MLVVRFDVEVRLDECFGAPLDLSSHALSCTVVLPPTLTLANAHIIISTIIPCEMDDSARCVRDEEGRVVVELREEGRCCVLLNWICMRRFRLSDYRLLWSNDAAWVSLWHAAPPYGIVRDMSFLDGRRAEPPLLEMPRCRMEISLWLLDGLQC
jgi:hypothetical protein